MNTLITKIIELEESFGILSRDLIYQDDLFSFQEQLCEALVKFSSPTEKKALATRLPYLFQIKQKPAPKPRKVREGGKMSALLQYMEDHELHYSQMQRFLYAFNTPLFDNWQSGDFRVPRGYNGTNLAYIKRKGLIQKVEGTMRYQLTAKGMANIDSPYSKL